MGKHQSSVEQIAPAWFKDSAMQSSPNSPGAASIYLRAEMALWSSRTMQEQVAPGEFLLLSAPISVKKLIGKTTFKLKTNMIRNTLNFSSLQPNPLNRMQKLKFELYAYFLTVFTSSLQKHVFSVNRHFVLE
jgi:hypothetical protein